MRAPRRTRPGPTTEAGVRRRFLVLTGLRWVPVGFLAPVLVLLPLSRGLSLPEVGVVFAVYGATTAVLELPTGGFADAFGRRLTLGLSSVLHLGFFGVMLVAHGLGPWVVAAVLGGVARALDSGPLQAWYVDEARRLEHDVELRPGLSAAGVVEGAGLALSAVVGGLLPAVGGNGLVVVVWAALGVQAGHLCAVLLLMTEHRPTGDGAAARGAVRRIPFVVRDGLRHAGRRGPVRALMGNVLVWGSALAAIEVLWQPRFVTLLGGDPGAAVSATHTALLGLLLAGAFLCGAGGAALTPRLTRLLGGSASRAATWATVVHGSTLAVLAAAAAVVPAAVAFVAFYFVNGFRGSLHQELLHEHVPAQRRSTMLSVESLSLQLGGIASTLLLPTVAAVTSIAVAWAGVAVLVVASAVLYRTVPDRPSATAGSPSA